MEALDFIRRFRACEAAAPATVSRGEVYAIRPLEWITFGGNHWFTDSLVGRFNIYGVAEADFIPEYKSKEFDGLASLESAKAFCQSHYEAAMRAGLVAIGEPKADASHGEKDFPLPQNWPPGLEQLNHYEFPCDDKGRKGGSWMRVMVAGDGDVHVSMQDWEDIGEEGSRPTPFPSVRCRTLAGGGRFTRTRLALLWLAQAIRLDQEARTVQK